MAKILVLDTMCRSKGIKLLYYDSVAADVSTGTEDGWDMIINKLGVENLNGGTDVRGNTIVDAHTASGGELNNSGNPFPHLHVYVKSFRVLQNPNNQVLSYTLVCEVTI